MGVVVGTAAPLLGAVAVTFLGPLVTSALGDKISGELVGTFLFGLRSFSITLTLTLTLTLTQASSSAPSSSA